MIYRSQLVGFGGYLPKRILTNDDLTLMVDTSDEAARQAIDYAGMSAQDIDAIVVATCTPDKIFPSTAVEIQKALGIKKAFGFDVSSACAGFVFGLSVADNFIRCGQAKNVLLIGSEVYSRILDWKDRRTCVLFGDGAGAVVLSAVNTETEGNSWMLSSYGWSICGFIICGRHTSKISRSMLFTYERTGSFSSCNNKTIRGY